MDSVENKDFLISTLQRFHKYMDDGAEFREKVVEHMAKANVTMENFSEHQTECESARADHVTRITQCERTQSNYRSIITSWVVGIPLLSGFATWLIKHSG